ncbi:SAM hydrolase/SAM-dependent halogenase family protein [Phytoactinopolyspora halotolerans]|uniref:SAM-dependent chlorinase/fluorinase n=1 Tax=Phytoactinopolyspora halotolerans TaxID=1981512 RepID=A0A6L9S9B9_9ACTN|nr:SAM-dependent chlorinase/fluorinase [Phytoactinopolyspora halotolerans]NEE01677.1 SAM-dependent chlorinase/fluorinase [Phytoactinopolyspora halotolerans]
MRYGWLAFLTDYGYHDGFVAACHGVIARIVPDARVIDVTHAVPPQDVRHGAVVLEQTVPYLPASVIVGVVDPGVGSERRGVALQAGESVLVGPDNGLLVWAADALGGASAAVELTAPEYRLGGDAATFHGRDIFAPAAAHVAAGVPLRALGPAVSVEDLVRLPTPRARARAGVVETEAHLVDHFGNVALAARADHLNEAGLAVGDRVDVTVSGGPVHHDVLLGRIFADVAPGEHLVYVDSHGYLSLATNQGDAASSLGVEPGDDVRVSRSHAHG